MWNKIRHIVLFTLLCCLSLGLYGQKSYPPEPGQKSHQQGLCGQGNGYENGTGNGRIPPPVGLCLPINDYLVPFLIMGILFGAYKIRKIHTESKEVT